MRRSVLHGCADLADVGAHREALRTGARERHGGQPQHAHHRAWHGGPLLGKVDGKLTIFGVASWVPSKSDKSPCSRGQVYAVFGASARELVDDVLGAACGDVPVAGRCEGALAVRCISNDEGTPRITRTNCDDVDQTCQVVDGKAACVDP